ncbi:MAG: DUF4190 domain-containing protein [Oscillospiraceae bacterium]|nr:DUF4190 domain-containing protein [Oscillospiraceae bacterium]
MAIAALVLGIISLVPLVPFPIGPISAVVGIVLGVLARKKASEAGTPTGMATAGMVLSIIGLALSIIFWAFCAAVLGAASLL